MSIIIHHDVCIFRAVDISSHFQTSGILVKNADFSNRRISHISVMSSEIYSLLCCKYRLELFLSKLIHSLFNFALRSGRDIEEIRNEMFADTLCRRPVVVRIV